MQIENPPVGPILVYWDCLCERVSYLVDPSRAPEWLVRRVLADFGMKAATEFDRYSWAECRGAARNEVELVEGIEHHLETHGPEHLDWIGIWYPTGKLMHGGRSFTEQVMRTRERSEV